MPQWFKVAASLQESTVHCLLVAALGILPTTLVTGLRGVLEGLQDFATSNILKVVLGCATFGLPALVVWTRGPSLTEIVVSLVAARAVVMVAHVLALRRRLPRTTPAARPPLKFDRVRPLLSFGAWMTLSNLISPLMVTADRFVVSALLGAGTVAYYTVPFDFLLRLLVLPAALTSALFPHLSALAGTDRTEFHRVSRRALRTVFIGMAPLCLLIALSSHLGLRLWLDAACADQAWAVASWMAVGLLFNAMAQVPHAALQAQGGVKTTALLHLAESLVYFPLLVGALLVFGITGAAMAWVARALADFLLLQHLARARS
jgi:O-antigen/teichoic acid export membrane protein